MKSNKYFSPPATKRVVIHPSHLVAEMQDSTRSDAKVWFLLALCTWGVLAIGFWLKS